MAHIRIFDTTLRDGEQTPGVALNTAQKVEIARQLARLGVDVIEAGFPITSVGDFEAVQRIAREVRGPIVCALARTAAPTSSGRAGDRARRRPAASTCSPPARRSTSSTCCARPRTRSSRPRSTACATRASSPTTSSSRRRTAPAASSAS
jgi:hypothetical protein